MARRHTVVLVVLASVLTLVARVVHADVFNMPAGQTSLQFVTVADPGNTADTAAHSGNLGGQGSVPYVYQIGRYDVTVGQYCQFLNAVAKTDALGLYYGGMATDLPTIGISQSSSQGSYTYSVSYSASAWSSYVTYNSSLYPSALAAAADCPIFDVTWGDAARFANWLQNGQPTNLGEAAGSTETGAYTLNGATSNSDLMAINRNAGATYFIPSEDEWYKSAFYEGGSQNAGYWIYPTQSNTVPTNVLSATGTNNANYRDYYGTAGNGGYSDATNKLTPVGAFAASPGSYGTYDQGGDVWQWNEAKVTGSTRGQRGGAWGEIPNLLPSNIRDSYLLTAERDTIGFRVASVPWGWHDPGDANVDGEVDINDLTIVLANYNQTGMAWSQGSMDGDPTGKVDINDLTLVLQNFGKTYAASAVAMAAVPEPSSLLLVLGLAVVSLAGSARWRRK